MNNKIDIESLENKLNEICKRCEYHLPFSDHTYDIVKALKRNKNKIFEGYFKKYKNNLAYFERYINKIAKDIFNNGRFNSSVLASSNKYLYNGELIIASSKEEAIQKHKVVAKFDISKIKDDLYNALENSQIFNSVNEKYGGIYAFSSTMMLKFDITVEGTSKPKFDIYVEGQYYIENLRLRKSKKVNSIDDVVRYCKKVTDLFDKLRDEIADTRDLYYKKIKSV